MSRALNQLSFQLFPLESFYVLNLVLKGEERRVAPWLSCVQGSARVLAKHRQPPLSTETSHSLESSQDHISSRIFSNISNLTGIARLLDIYICVQLIYEMQLNLIN